MNKQDIKTLKNTLNAADYSTRVDALAGVKYKIIALDDAEHTAIIKTLKNSSYYYIEGSESLIYLLKNNLL